MAYNWDPWLYYMCCEVFEKTKDTTPCWVCGEGKGVNYYEHYSEVDNRERPYYETTSRVHLQFSLVQAPQLKRSHP
jgi:hypothetical protein